MSGTQRIFARLGPVATVLLLVGLVAAIGTDGRLPAASTQVLLGVLLVLDVIAAGWLTRPRD
ncbi:MAG: hypothetical protein M3Q03_19040 [Chloroflexota bacterium]|nr:hypothetical protein [Chloroflexota bacterium]MDP9370336.1 hypothetical protein [Chloroflexota bacterium]